MGPHKKRVFACFVLILAIFTPMAFAAPNLKVTPIPPQISTGQNAVLILQLEWSAAEDPYEIHSLEPKVENLELIDQNQSQETGPVISQTIKYSFRPLKKGSALIYPFEISYRKTETVPWIPILIPQQTIKVVSSLPVKAVLIGMGLLAGFSALAFAVFKIWNSLKARAAARNIPPPDPKQRVYAKAEESIATFTSPNPKEKLIYWANQLRTVIVTYYDIPSKASTSAEVLSFLRSKGLPAGEWNEISRLFEQLTEMQFSRQDIPAYDLDRMQKTLLQYVKGKIIIGNSNF